MKMKFTSRRQKAKSATIKASKQTVEQAVQIANSLVEAWMNEDQNDPRINEVEQAAQFLSSILTKNPQQMAAEGVSSIEEYFDDAVKPEVANKVKQMVDMIAKMRNEQRPAKVQQTAPVAQPVPQRASDKKANGAAFVSDRDEKGEPKTPEKAEVPRLASDKKAAPAAAPVAPAPAAVAPAPIPENGSFDIKTLSTEALAKAIKALVSIKEFEEDKSAQALIEEMTAELKTRPIEQDEPKAAPAAAPAAVPAAAPAAAPVAPLPVAASKKAQEDPSRANVPLGGLAVAATEEGERHDDVPVAPTPNVFQGGDDTKAEDTKVASGNGGSWFVSPKDKGLDVLEDGGRTPEIAEAHSKQDDKTGISRPATDDIRKFAAEMTVTKAVKLAEKVGNDLKNMYLEAKSLTTVNDTRPVREAVEAIYRAADMFDEATKVLNKQQMQEQAEEEATKIKDQQKKKSSFGGLALSATE